MADNKIRMPSSGAGLTSFYEESTSKFRIAPQLVLALTLIVIVVVMILNSTAPVTP
ncbi:preprotein translocase subunit Sec61beta [Candidatus Woesearchaeota archaeon]|nr:preprotein translocase subunit Sec61beta [Candidatus Woesearchaeota archaeon]